jgi:uncharacterized protein (TIGR02265 family)
MLVNFRTPNMMGALDLAALEADVPPEAMTRGMFFADVAEALKKRGLPAPAKSYNSFGYYPQREFIMYAGNAARTIFPEETPREALRRLGQLAYPTFKETMIGKVMFGVLGSDLGSIMKLVPKGYAAVLSHGRAEYIEGSATHCHIRLTDIYTFLDSYQVGVFEGAIIACNRQGDVKLRLDSPTCGEFWVEWE